MEVVIVLGNRREEIMKERVECAIRYARSKNCYLLLSGGSSDGVSKPEGSVMMERYVMKSGIDMKKVLVEKESRNTIENLINSKAILEEIFPKYSVPKPTLRVCTSSFHLPRSMMIAHQILNGWDISALDPGSYVSEEDRWREGKLMFDTMFGLM